MPIIRPINKVTNMTADDSNLSRIEHKVDLLLRLQGLTCEQIKQIVEAKNATAAQQALIDHVCCTNKAAKDPKATA